MTIDSDHRRSGSAGDLRNGVPFGSKLTDHVHQGIFCEGSLRVNVGREHAGREMKEGVVRDVKRLVGRKNELA
jgi:hypothetical protein